MQESFKQLFAGEDNPNWKGGSVAIQCQWCKTPFDVCPAIVGKRRFCSRKCRTAWDRTRKGPANALWRGGKSATQKRAIAKHAPTKPAPRPKHVTASCETCGAQWVVVNRPNRIPKRCAACRRLPINSPMYKGKAVMIACAKCGKTRKWWDRPDIARPAHCMKCYSASLGASKNPNWKGGITPENRLVRASPAYINWRISVFTRDRYTCQRCSRVGGELHAHHIIPFSKDRDKRLDIANGQTLCKDCHKETDSYLSKAKR